jgi:hypothetical protein
MAGKHKMSFRREDEERIAYICSVPLGPFFMRRVGNKEKFVPITCSFAA